MGQQDVDRALAALSKQLAPGSIRWDADPSSLTVARDPLGCAALKWANSPDGVLVSDSESLLLTHSAVASDFDEDWLAAYVAGVSPGHDETVWKSIRWIAAGETRRWTLQGTRAAMTRPEPLDCWRGLDLGGRARVLRDLIEAAVSETVKDATRIGISLSSGLDSSVLAVHLRPHRSEIADPARPVAVTYGFDGFPAIDERPASSRTADHLGLLHIPIAVDELRPLRPACRRPVDPDTPLQSPWREFKEASYRAFAAHGVDTVVSGNFGDHLWAHPRHWCLEALRDRRLDVLLQGLRSTKRSRGWQGWRHDPGLRALARPWRRPGAPPRLAVLRAPWRERLTRRLEAELHALSGWPRPEQAHLLWNAWASFDSCGEAPYASRHGIRVVQPFRHLELIRAMLTLPAYESQRGSVTKFLLRRAYRDELPERIREQSKVGHLTAFALHADQQEAGEIRRLAAIATPILGPFLVDEPSSWTTPGDLDWMLASFGLWLERREDFS